MKLEEWSPPRENHLHGLPCVCEDFTQIETELVAQIREATDEQHLRDTDQFIQALREMAGRPR